MEYLYNADGTGSPTSDRYASPGSSQGASSITFVTYVSGDTVYGFCYTEEVSQPPYTRPIVTVTFSHVIGSNSLVVTHSNGDVAYLYPASSGNGEATYKTSGGKPYRVNVNYFNLFQADGSAAPGNGDTDLLQKIYEALTYDIGAGRNATLLAIGNQLYPSLNQRLTIPVLGLSQTSFMSDYVVRGLFSNFTIGDLQNGSGKGTSTADLLARLVQQVTLAFYPEQNNVYSVSENLKKISDSFEKPLDAEVSAADFERPDANPLPEQSGWSGPTGRGYVEPHAVPAGGSRSSWSIDVPFANPTWTGVTTLPVTLDMAWYIQNVAPLVNPVAIVFSGAAVAWRVFQETKRQ